LDNNYSITIFHRKRYSEEGGRIGQRQDHHGALITFLHSFPKMKL
jgi:hypothetical protein